MIVTFTPNPAVDLTLDLHELDRGASATIPPSGTRAGGKGVNVARVLAQAGHPVIAAGPLGRDDAGWFARDLPGVETRFTPARAATRRTFAIVESATGTTTQLNEIGFARTPEEWDSAIDVAIDAARTADCLVVSGSLPPRTPADAVTRLVGGGTRAGVRVVADLVGEALWAAARAGAHLLKPNAHELATTTGAASPEEGATALLASGAGNVLVSLGEQGLLLVRADGGIIRARLDSPLRGNPTGAGDAAVAAVAASLAEGLSLDADADAILRRAVAWSAAAVLAPLAGALDDRHPELLPRVLVTSDRMETPCP